MTTTPRATDGTAGTAGTAGTPWARRLLRPTVTLPAGVAAVFFVAGVVHLTRSWYPYGDWAVAELVLRHTDRYLPLSGPYSAQRGYNHPLPLVYAIQWLPYEVFGQRSAAGLATTIWWNGAWLAFLVWLLARARATWLGVVALATVPVMAGHVPSGSLILPWNPSLALVPGLVLVFVAWRVAVGSRRLLPVMVALAVWCAGAHLGFAPMALAVSAAGLVGLVATTVHRGGRGALRTLGRPVLVAGATALLLTSPLLVDLVRNGDSSNPVHIVERGRPEPDAATVPRSELMKVLRAELAVPPAWATTTPPYDAFLDIRSPQFPTVLVVGLAAAVAALRRRAHDELVGLGISLLGVVAATAGLANIEAGTLQPWYLLSAHAASMAFCAFVVWSVGRSLIALLSLVRNRASTAQPVPERTPATGATTPVAILRGVAAPVVAVAAAVLVVPSLHIQPHAPTIDGPSHVLAEAVGERYAPGTRLEIDGPIDFDGYVTQSLALRLDRAGFDVRVPDDQLYLFTPALEAPAGWSGTTLVVQIAEADAPPPHPDAQLVASAPISHPIFTAAETAAVWELPPG